jgi:hypothetical protein
MSLSRSTAMLMNALALALGASILALLAVAPAHAESTPASPAAASPAPPASESANPINDEGGSYRYRSLITSVSPSTPGLGVQVLEFADRLLLTNHTGKTITIYGYSGEPYARVLANGTAEQNEHAPATYLNTNFYGDVNVPPSASPHAPVHWVVVDRTGQFEWHDHRIHWMSPVPPPQVKNKSKRTLIFNWHVPIQVGTRMGAVSGQLFWTPESSSASPVVIVLGVVIVLAGLLLVFVVRRRRSRAAHASVARGAANGTDGGKEAW